MRAASLATAAVVVTAASLAACDAPSRAVSPRPARASADLVTAAGPPADPVRDALLQLFASDGNGKTALGLYDAASRAATSGDPKATCPAVRDLVALTLDDYNAGAFGTVGGADLLPAVQRVIVGLNPLCPDVAPPSFPLAALGTNGAMVYVRRELGANVETHDGLAGVAVPPGAHDQDAILFIARRLTKGPDDDVLHTTLGVAPYYDISTYPHVNVLKPVSIGLVQVGPYTAEKNVDVILGHWPGTGSTTETPTPTQCTVPSRLFALFVAPQYLAGRRPSLSRAAGGPARDFGFVNDSSGTAGGCGSAGGYSPFGLVRVFEPGSVPDAKRSLTATYVCGSTFEIRNDGRGDFVAIWRRMTPGAGPATLSDPTPVLVPAGGSVRVDLGSADDGSALRLQYGPAVIGTTALPAVQRSCD